MRTIYEVIKRPLQTEKVIVQTTLGNQVSFEVGFNANKQEIRDAVTRLFDVKVEKVRTLIVHGKVKRVGGSPVQRPNWKKAIVTLAAGQKIDFHKVG